MSLSDPSLKPWDAKDYQKTFSYVWKAAEDLIELLGPQKDEHILDLGCGTAELTAKIAASGAQVMGLDASAEMIALARQKFPSLKFVQADVREVMSPLDGSSVFSPHSFDAVFSNATLHWVLEPERVIQGVVKLLKPGGRFVTEFGGQGNLLFLHKALDESFRLVTKKEPPSLWYFPSISGYTSLVESQGLEVTFASLFDRPTALEGGDEALAKWVRMFGSGYLKHLSPDEVDPFLKNVQKEAEPLLRQNGQWSADYRRLRIVAYKRY